MSMEITPAIDFFLLLFQLSIWAIGVIFIAYIIKILLVMIEHVKTFKQRAAARKSSKVPRR